MADSHRKIDPNKPERYPAPVTRKGKDKKDHYDIYKLTADKAARRVIAAYVKTVRRRQKLTPEKKPERDVLAITRKTPSDIFRNLSEFLLESVDLSALLHETADVMKNVTKSTGVVVYTVDNSVGEIIQCPRNVQSARHHVNWKIGKGSTIAAYVASAKEYVLVNDILTDTRFPEGVGWLGNENDNEDTGPIVKSVLCIPVMTPEDECLAIIELFKNGLEPPYTKIDVQIIVAVTGWMGAAIHQNQQRVAYQKQQELNDYLLDLTKNYFSDVVEVEKIISEIVVFAKATLQAERGSFFIIDQECDEVVADLYEEGTEEESLTMHKKKFKVRFNKDRGIAAIVAHTKKMINIRDAYNDPRFNKEIDMQTGFITRSILCMPILAREGLLGVVQLVNKRNGLPFTSIDENTFKTFAVYCALALHYDHLQTNLRRMNYQNDIKTSMLTFQMKPCPHDIQNTQFLTEQTSLPENFLTFGWYVTGFENKMCEFALFMLNDLIEEVNSERDNWKEFVLTCRKSYRLNPYHNFEHAFNVCHCMYNIVKRNLDIFTPLEVRALMVGSLCHDLDHPGFTNNFMLTTNHSLAQLYPESTLENHHFQVAMLIINSCNIFSNFTKQTFKELTQEIHDCIIATDLAFYFRCRSRLLNIMDKKEFDWEEGTHRVLLKGIMMTTSDLSGQCKPFTTAKIIVGRLYREFYVQGDTERRMNMCPLSLMDREKQHMIPEDQVQFISVICIPCVQLMVDLLPNTKPILTLCEELRDNWKELMDLQNQAVWRQEDSFT